jgi:VWFA-related protein
MTEIHLVTRRELLVRAALTVAGNVVMRAQSQTGAQRPNFTTGVEVVNVSVTVRDKSGRLVTDLSRDEFSISEDGRPQAISFFSRESELPLTVGLLVDTTPSESNMLEVEKSASLAFFSRMLRPDKDKAFLVQYYSEIELLQGLTSKRGELEAGLDKLQAHGGRGRGGPGPAGDGGDSGGRYPQLPVGPGLATALADAVFHSAREIMELQGGRKALLVLGDGDHVGDRLRRAISAAQGADTVIYPIRIYDKNAGTSAPTAGIHLPGGITIGPGGGGARGGIGGGIGAPHAGPPPGGPSGGGQGGGTDVERGKENLKQLARQTGGTYFEAGKRKDSLDQIYEQIEEELRSQYRLGYTPDAKALDGYRAIKVSVGRKGMVVRAREGYDPRVR